MSTNGQGEWVDGPPPVERTTRWSAVVEELKAHPGRWKKFEVNYASSTRQHLINTYPGVEATTREDRYLWVRWPKGLKSE